MGLYQIVFYIKVSEEDWGDFALLETFQTEQEARAVAQNMQKAQPSFITYEIVPANFEPFYIAQVHEDEQLREICTSKISNAHALYLLYNDYVSMYLHGEDELTDYQAATCSMIREEYKKIYFEIAKRGGHVYEIEVFEELAWNIVDMCWWDYEYDKPEDVEQEEKEGDE